MGVGRGEGPVKSWHRTIQRAPDKQGRADEAVGVEIAFHCRWRMNRVGNAGRHGEARGRKDLR